jgi:chromosomal replication initiator protein
MKTEDIIVYEVCKCFNVNFKDIRSPKRNQDIVVARFILVHMLKKYFDWSLHGLAYFVGRTDHTTIINALGRAQDMINSDKSLQEVVDDITRKVDKKSEQVLRLKRTRILNVRGYIWNVR